MFILNHNVWTRNARKLIKVSKDSDSSLVTNENISDIFPSSGWPDNMSQNGLKTYLTYDITHKKPKTKTIFFIADSKTSPVFWGFEQLFSAIDLRSYAVGKTTEICLILGRSPGMIYSYPGSSDARLFCKSKQANLKN